MFGLPFVPEPHPMAMLLAFMRLRVFSIDASTLFVAPADDAGLNLRRCEYEINPYRQGTLLLPGAPPKR
jgi:hypothetical protein